MAVREERALDNMRRAIDMQEVFERVAIRAHGSYMPHGAVFKTTQDILLVADVQKFRLSKCELQNAVTKRTANSGASRSLELRDSGKARAPALKFAEGPANMVTTKGYSTTSAISTCKKVDAVQVLRRGASELASIPESRQRERLFGVEGPGRTKALSTGPSLARLGDGYDPRCDSCVRAFARLW